MKTMKGKKKVKINNLKEVTDLGVISKKKRSKTKIALDLQLKVPL
jgi:dihydroneopterin aldolase